MPSGPIGYVIIYNGHPQGSLVCAFRRRLGVARRGLDCVRGVSRFEQHCGDCIRCEAELENLLPCLATLDGAVNKRFLSTGETGGLVQENVGFGLNPGVDLALPRRLLSIWRDCPARENLRNVADTGDGGGHRCCQDNGPGNLARGRYGSAGRVQSAVDGDGLFSRERPPARYSQYRTPSPAAELASDASGSYGSRGFSPMQGPDGRDAPTTASSG